MDARQWPTTRLGAVEHGHPRTLPVVDPASGDAAASEKGFGDLGK